MRIAKAGRRWLLLGHRWLGIGTGVFFALWIASGLVMLFVPFCSLTPAERLARLNPIAWDGVGIGPDAALTTAGTPGPAAGFSLEMRGAEPVYRLNGPDGGPLTLSARDGRSVAPASEEEALRLAGGVPGRARVETVWRDQWTVTARYDPQRPFRKVSLDDEAGTELYVSVPTGAIVLDTTRAERAWNWVGAVTHWVYLTPLRARQETWRQAVLWLSGVSSLTALTGMTIGIWRLRLRRRYRGGAVSPYRGLALVHHAFGLFGGVGLVTFIVSGWLSMNPNHWFSSLTPPAPIRAAFAGHPGPVGLGAPDIARLAGPEARLLRFEPIGGRWWVFAETADGPRPLGTAGPDRDALAQAAAGAVPGGHLVRQDWIAAHDAYWSARGGTRPLPVLRLVFDDPAATWLHVDPRDGTLLNRLDRAGRANRWLFDAPHRLDIPGLESRLAAQWCLNLLAAGIALSGLVLGWRRLRRG